jgi:hypothetical protein
MLAVTRFSSADPLMYIAHVSDVLTANLTPLFL